MDRTLKAKTAGLFSARNKKAAAEIGSAACEVVRDLVPLYSDGAASERTRSFVESHLRVCSDCAGYYRMVLAAARKKHATERAGRMGVGGFAGVAGRIRRRRAFWTAAAALALAVSLGINLFILLSRRDK